MSTSDILWTLLSLFIIGLAYFAAFAFVAGLLWKLVGYLRTSTPLPHALTPAPRTEGGAVVRVLGEVTLFQSLFKADKLLWAGAWVFHIALAAILFRHLRYFTYPIPNLILYMEPVALFFGSLFGAAALFLFWRRLGLPRSLYVSDGQLLAARQHCGCQRLHPGVDDFPPGGGASSSAFPLALILCTDFDDLFPL